MDVYKLDKFEHIYAVDCFDKGKRLIMGRIQLPQ